MGIVDYVRDTRAEMKHVVWPTRQQAILYTVAVVAISVLLAVVLGAGDALFTYLIKLITLR